MQRDLGNEVIVAIAAVGILAFAITFAIILSLSNTPEATATATIPSNISGGSPIATAVASGSTNVAPTENTIATLTSIAATVQQAQTSVSTATIITAETTQQAETALPTQSLVIAETVEPGETQATAETIVTKTTAAIPTQDSATTRSNTGEPPKASATSESAQINPSITPTPHKPNVTATKGITPSPTFTSSPLPPSATPSPKPTKTQRPTATLTRTPRPTETSGIRPTPTAFVTANATVSPNSCMPPQDWVIYVVGQGDTLLKIAQAVGSSLVELQKANCLTDINNIFAGTPIYVPRMPVMPINSGTNVPGGTNPLQPEGCTDPNVQITNLQPGQVISGVFNVMGTAKLSDFWYYKLEVRPDFATIYNFYSRSETAVVDGSLGQIDQSIFGIGIHWIKLTVIGKTNGATPCAIPVIFQ
jgi:hypothetical protein